MMFGLVVAVAALIQTPEYVAGYKPKVGDRIVLARDEAGRKVPIVKNAGAAMGFESIVRDSDFNYEAVVDGSTELTEIDGGTAVQIVENIKYGREKPLIFKVRILEGPLKGKTAYAYTIFFRKPNPAFVKAAAERRKKRGPLDKRAIAAEIKDALEKAKPNEVPGDLTKKKQIVREAVEPICEKHQADYKEINALATQAGVFVMIGGEKYDVAGNRMKK